MNGAPRPELSSRAPGPTAGAAALCGFYFLHFATIGITLPFLPAYFESLDFSGTQIGLLLAVGPLFALLAPPFWAQLADRTGRPDRILTLMGVGALTGFACLIVAKDFAWVALALAVYASFASGITTIIDSLTLARISHSGGSFARIRLFGSAGFVVSSTLFGLSVDVVDDRAVTLPLLLIASYAAWSLLIRARTTPDARTSQSVIAGARTLLRDRDLAVLLCACALHWIACAPFHGTYALYVRDLGFPPAVVGLSAGTGVVAEIAAMFVFPKLSTRVSPKLLLAVSFLGSTLRWLGTAAAPGGAGLVALSLLHGVTFGIFYVSAVAYVSQRVPETMRARGQALFVSITYGVGGLLGYAAAGAGYDLLGGSGLFVAAALLELAPAALLLALHERSTASPQG